MLLDFWLLSNIFLDTIAEPILYEEKKRQKRFDLVYWLQWFWNSPYIMDKNNNNLDVNFYNIS